MSKKKQIKEAQQKAIVKLIKMQTRADKIEKDLGIDCGPLKTEIAKVLIQVENKANKGGLTINPDLEKEIDEDKEE